MRELAIQRLFCITCPVEKIVLAHTFSIPDWLPKAYAELCKREAPLTVDEGRDLFDLGWIGCDIVIHLNQASYEWRKRVGIYGTPVNVDGEVTAIVTKVFQLGSEPSETARGDGGQETALQREDLIDDFSAMLNEDGSSRGESPKLIKKGVTTARQKNSKKGLGKGKY
jgi:hypothetical protein